MDAADVRPPQLTPPTRPAPPPSDPITEDNFNLSEFGYNMEAMYDQTALDITRMITLHTAYLNRLVRLCNKRIRHDYYNLYSLIWLSRQTADNRQGEDAYNLLLDLAKETYAALQRGYSSNPIIHAFQLTALNYQIDKPLLTAFFASLAMDLKPRHHNQASYEQYLYGSAEVPALMCLKIACQGDAAQYNSLKADAQRLGAAYQKINFLCRLSVDLDEFGRGYFPGLEAGRFSEAYKRAIIREIMTDLEPMPSYLKQLPGFVQLAATASFNYQLALLARLEATPATIIRHQVIGLPEHQKLKLLATAITRHRLSRN